MMASGDSSEVAAITIRYYNRIGTCTPSRSGDEMGTNTKFMLRTHEHSIGSFYATVNSGMRSPCRARAHTLTRYNSIEIENGKMGSTNGIALRSTIIFSDEIQNTETCLRRSHDKPDDRPTVTHMITK